MAVIDKFAHSSTGTFVARVQGAVAERNTPVQITYSLTNDKGWFEINSTTGVITVAKTLDREVIIHYNHKGLTISPQVLFTDRQTARQPLFEHDENSKLCSLWGHAKT